VLAKANDPDLPTLKERLVGVNYAIYDSTLYTQYLDRLMSTFPESTLSLASTENYYDAAYFLIYALAAAGDRATYDGLDVLDGMEKLIRGDVPTDPCEPVNACFSIDNLMINSTLSYLTGSLVGPSGIALVGTMGPPNFDRATGVRQSATSVWCVDDDGSGGVQFVSDVLAYRPDTGELEGTFSCFDGF
jgi:hypothetical protein